MARGAPKGNKYAEGVNSKYKEEYAEEVYEYLLLFKGAEDKDIANRFNVAESTINLWKKEYPKFSESIFKGKEPADGKVAKSFYTRATGYDHDGKHYPADSWAAMRWLNNRQGKHWKDRNEVETHNTLEPFVITCKGEEIYRAEFRPTEEKKKHE